MQSLHESEAQMPPTAVRLTCVICGSRLYPTDQGNAEITYHCSSPEARFWDFDRGTAAQHQAKKHWDESIQEIFLNRS